MRRLSRRGNNFNFVLFASLWNFEFSCGQQGIASRTSGPAVCAHRALQQKVASVSGIVCAYVSACTYVRTGRTRLLMMLLLCVLWIEQKAEKAKREAVGL